MMQPELRTVGRSRIEHRLIPLPAIMLHLQSYTDYGGVLKMALQRCVANDAPRAVYIEVRDTRVAHRDSHRAPPTLGASL